MASNDNEKRYGVGENNGDEIERELTAEVEEDYVPGPANEVREGAGADREARETRSNREDLTAADVDYEYLGQDEALEAGVGEEINADAGAYGDTAAVDDAVAEENATAGVAEPTADTEIDEDLAVAGRLNADVVPEDEAERTEAVNVGDEYFVREQDQETAEEVGAVDRERTEKTKKEKRNKKDK